MQTPDPNLLTYRCKKCRTSLFESKAVVPHEKGEGQSAFAFRKRTQGTNQECTSIFIDTEKIPWVADLDTSPIEGKILCPKCNSRVGTWKWDGGQCSCGAWQTPSFQFLRARVDEDLKL